MEDEMSTATIIERPASERAFDALKRSGNAFRNYFARNPDDEVCARYHVPELFAAERTPLAAAEIARRLHWPKSSANMLMQARAAGEACDIAACI